MNTADGQKTENTTASLKLLDDKDIKRDRAKPNSGDT